MTKKLTTEERKQKFIQKSMTRHDNTYNYSKVNYIDCQSKVIIICPIHGELF
jgi:hypothetical protein